MDKKIRISPKGVLILLYTVFFIGCTLFLVIQICGLIDDFNRIPETKDLSKDALFGIVSANRDTLLEDIEQGDYSRTRQLFAAYEDVPRDILPENGKVTYECGGFGFGPETGYWGFYYSSWDGPVNVDGIMTPYAGYFRTYDRELIDHLTPEGNGFAWYESSVNPRGDNTYYTERICEGFWYYLLEY